MRHRNAQFSGSLRNICARADLTMNRLLESIGEWARYSGLAGKVGPAERYARTDVGDSPRRSLALGQDVRTAIWATGVRPAYSWLDVPVFDRKDALKHARGIVDAPGLPVPGFPILVAGSQAACPAPRTTCANALSILPTASAGRRACRLTASRPHGLGRQSGLADVLVARRRRPPREVSIGSARIPSNPKVTATLPGYHEHCARVRIG